MDLQKKARKEKIARETYKFIICMMVFLFCIVASTFGEGGVIDDLEGQANKLMALFEGKIIAIIMCIALMIIFGIIAWGNSQGEGGMFKKMLPWIVGVIGIGSAAGITQYFLGISID